MKKLVILLSILFLSGCTTTCLPNMELKPIDREHEAWECRQKKLDTEFKQARYSFLGTAAADLGTTIYAIEKYNATESHLFLQGFEKPYIPMVLSDAIVWGVAEWAYSKGQVKEAMWLYRIGAVVRLGATSWNTYQIIKNK